MAEPLLTPEIVARRLAVSRSMVYALLKRGAIPDVVYIGRLPRVTEEGLRLYLETAKASGAAPSSRPTTPEHADR